MAALVTLLAACTTSKDANQSVVDRIDHLVFAVADLNEGIAQIEAATGVRAELGGAHPGGGTHNALLALGPRVYLEIVAPDPQQANPRPLETLGLSATRRSRMVAWALHSTDLERLATDAAAKGFPMAAPMAGNRQLPDGSMLSWRIATLADQRTGDGLAPFFIDWGSSKHPAVTSPQGAKLLGLRAQHPSAQSAQSLFGALKIPLTIETAPELAFIAVLETPRGRVELR
jgi:hypothetical protein